MLSGQNLTSPRTEIPLTPLNQPPARPVPSAPASSVIKPYKDPRAKPLGGSDLLDPAIIIGRYKLLLGLVEQC